MTKKISQLSAATPVSGDKFEFETAAGISKQCDFSTLAAAAEGTSFPGSPSTGQRYIRTDRQIEYYYDGTRWLSTQLFVQALGIQSTLSPYIGTNAGALVAPNPWAGIYDIYIADVVFQYYLSATGNWTMAFTNAAGTSLSSTTASTVTTRTTVRNAYNTVFANSGANQTGFGLNLTENSGSGDLYPQCAITYRLVG
jgi:hypothetical protein